MELDLSAGFRNERDLDTVVAQARATFARAPLGLPLVLISDWRGCQVLPMALAERTVALMGRPVPRVVWHASLITSEYPTAFLQIRCMVEEANNEGRRLFTDVDTAEQWLGDKLDGLERARLATFLRRQR